MAVSLCAAFILSYCAKSPASNVPEMECHTQETAQIIADSGVEANCAVVVARFVARPAFCIPTSVSYTHLDSMIAENCTKINTQKC